jgi:probable O-glycosylation ligase (exosortase A-associated)
MPKTLILVYILTFGGTMVAIVDPFVGFLIYVFYAIMQPDWCFSYASTPVHHSQFIVGAMLLGWLLRTFGDWRFGKARPLAICLCGYMLCTTLAVFPAPNQELAWTYVTDIGKIILPAFVGLTLIDSVARLKQLAWAIVLGHGYVGFECNYSYLVNHFNKVWMQGWGAGDNNCIAISIVASLGLAFFLFLFTQRNWQKGLLLILVLLMLHTILLSFSRGAMLALAITCLLTFIMMPKKPAYCILAGGFVAVAIMLSGKEVVERFEMLFSSQRIEADNSAVSRLHFWMACLEAMARDPILGVGAGNWPVVAGRFNSEFEGRFAHSLWLQLGAEIGIPGLLCLVLFYGVCLKRLLPIARGREKVRDPWLRYCAFMVIAALIGFGVSASFVSVYSLEAPYYIGILGAGVLKVHSLLPPGKQRPAATTQRRAFAQPNPFVVRQRPTSVPR